MRILILHRPNGPIGGDTGHATGYAGGLRANGIDVEVRPAVDLRDIKTFDYVHMFAAVSPDWGLPVARYVKEQGVPFIVSPIWWSRKPRLDFYHLGDDLYPGYTQQVSEILRLADVLAVFTMSEAVECWKIAPQRPVKVMGVGHDGLPADVIANLNGYEDRVITIGRIEKHKNQVNLAIACRELNVPLLCVGPVVDEPYGAKVTALGGELSGQLGHDETMQLLATSRVYALPSFSENVSVASLEAARLGVPAVLSWIGCEPEFFGAGPVYCNPANWRDIATAIEAAWQKPRGRWAEVRPWRDVAIGMISWMGREAVVNGR